jgi:hypothetical protein
MCQVFTDIYVGSPATSPSACVHAVTASVLCSRLLLWLGTALVASSSLATQERGDYGRWADNKMSVQEHQPWNDSIFTLEA